MPKPVSRTSPSAQFTRIWAGFEVLVDEAALVGLAQRRGDADREAQEAARLHRRADEPSERLPARILEHQHGPAVLAHELQRPRRPGAVQLIFQLIFVREPIEDERRRVFRGDEQRQHGLRLPSAPTRDPRQRKGSPSSDKTRKLSSIGAEPREGDHLLASLLRLPDAISIKRRHRLCDRDCRGSRRLLAPP